MQKKILAADGVMWTVVVAAGNALKVGHAKFVLSRSQNLVTLKQTAPVLNFMLHSFSVRLTAISQESMNEKDWGFTGNLLEGFIIA